jgi:uncharacterized protein YrrD
MEIPISAKVSCAAGECGDVACLLVNPATKQVTHVVVKERGFLGQERIVPIEFVEESFPDKISLHLAPENLRHMENFNEIEYVSGKGTFDGQLVEQYFSQPFVIPDYDAEDEHYYTHVENIPPGELAIHTGAEVYAHDGLIGKVDGFLISAVDDKISHLVMREGHLWGRRHITIPVTAIERIDPDGIHLTLNKAAVGKQPSAPVHYLQMHL